MSLIALLNASYLLFLTLNKSETCVAGLSCIEILQSKFAIILSVPLPVFGIAYFAGLLFLSLRYTRDKQGVKPVLFLYLLIGTFASAYFMAIQFVILKAFCLFCTLSATIVLLLILSVFFTDRKFMKKVSLSLLAHSAFVYSITVVLTVLIGLLGLLQLLKSYDVNVTSQIAISTNIGDFSTDDLDALAGIKPLQIEDSLYRLRKDTLITHLISVEREALGGLSEAEFYQAFITHGFSILSEEDLEKIKTAKMSNTLKNILSENKPMTQEIHNERLDKFLMDLEKKYEISYNLYPKTSITVQPNPHYVLSEGNIDAPIKITIFSDFLCSHCAIVHKILEKEIKNNPDLFYIEYRHFSHMGDLSNQLAKLSVCAHKQGQFPAFATNYYDHQKELTMSTFLSYLPRNLDIQDMQKCFYSPLPKQVVDADMKEVERLRINATPTFIINGYLGSKTILENEIKKFSAPQ
jgi:uncharacterized membrane protein